MVGCFAFIVRNIFDLCRWIGDCPAARRPAAGGRLRQPVARPYRMFHAPQLKDDSCNSQGRPLRTRRKHVPRSVVVPEEAERYISCCHFGFDAYAAPVSGKTKRLDSYGIALFGASQHSTASRNEIRAASIFVLQLLYQPVHEYDRMLGGKRECSPRGTLKRFSPWTCRSRCSPVRRVIPYSDSARRWSTVSMCVFRTLIPPRRGLPECPDGARRF